MQHASLDEMWDVIERFGIKRKLVDPHDDLSQVQVEKLYGSIREREGFTSGSEEK